MITQPKFSKLNTTAFFAFYGDVVKSIERHEKETLTPYTAPIQAMYLKLEAGYKLSRKNEITAEIKILDKQRDRALSSMKKILEGYKLFYESNKVEAAKRLLYSLKKYGDISRLKYSEQSAALKSLFNEWKGDILKENLELLHLSGCVENLNLIQKQFELRYLDRAENDATKKTIPISKLIPEATKLYQNFVLILTAFFQMNPNEYEPLVKLLDELGKKYNEAIRENK